MQEQETTDTIHDTGSICKRWSTLELRKLPLIRRCEEYAMWTLPYLFPILGTSNTELNGPVDGTGARAVNNLANKLVMTLFQPHAPFFRLNVSQDVVQEMTVAAEDGDEDAKEFLAIMDKDLAEAEKQAMQELNYNRFRTEATMAAKALIVTGNTLMYYPEDESNVQTYNLRDYCVVRDPSGTVIEIITRDKKAFSTFSEEKQTEIRKANRNKKYTPSCTVTLYTRVCKKDDGKYHMTQAADDYTLDSTAVWTSDEMPYIPLTWNLVRGEDYGRGLVEDFAGAFHGLHVLNSAMYDLVAISADIKFLVDPASVLDVQALNDSESGTYHTGREGDISVPQLNKQWDMQFIQSAIANLQQQIAQAFLLNSSVARDAERVTAEEIRLVAQELEVSHGGIYSRFAEEWQLKLAVLLLTRMDYRVNKTTIYPQIITGLDSLSRAGDLDNLRMFVADMQLLEGVPEDIRAVIDPMRFAEYIGVRRGVDYQKFTKTAAQLQAEQQAAMQMQQQVMQMQVGASVAEEAGKQALQQ